MPNKYWAVDGIATYLHHLGPTTLPDVPPDLSRGEFLLLVHGGGGNGNTYAALMQRLAARHSPLGFDFPAHGRSGGIDSLPSIERMAGFVQTLAGALTERAPVLIGHSMGGAVSLTCALQRPDAVRALVLIGSAARFPLPDAYIDQVRRVTEGKERRAITREAFSPATPQEVVRQGIMEDLKTDPRAVYGDLIACRAWSGEDRLAEIRTPTLVLVGEDELPPLREQSELLAQRVPGAQRQVIPKAGHMLPLEQPEAVADAIDAFLAEHAA